MRLEILSALVALAVALGCDNQLSADPTTGPGGTSRPEPPGDSGGSGGEGGGGAGGNSGFGSSQQELLSPDGRYAFPLERSTSGDELVIFLVESGGRRTIDAIRIPDGAEGPKADASQPRLYVTYPDRELTYAYDLEDAR